MKSLEAARALSAPKGARERRQSDEDERRCEQSRAGDREDRLERRFSMLN
jgi:hypothetical protein